jgi:hypothetical protein
LAIPRTQSFLTASKDGGVAVILCKDRLPRYTATQRRAVVSGRGLVMAITVEAVYEDGVLKPTQPLPFKEHQRVRLTVQTNTELQTVCENGPRGYGLIHWTGSLDDLDYLIEHVANDPLEGA